MDLLKLQLPKQLIMPEVAVAVIMPEVDYTYLDLLLILDIIQDIPQIFM